MIFWEKKCKKILCWTIQPAVGQVSSTGNIILQLTQLETVFSCISIKAGRGFQNASTLATKIESNSKSSWPFFRHFSTFYYPNFVEIHLKIFDTYGGRFKFLTHWSQYLHAAFFAFAVLVDIREIFADDEQVKRTSRAKSPKQQEDGHSMET